MPEGGITVYAKWRQKQYRVFLHPNYPDGAIGNIDWGAANQQLVFRISEGGHVSEPTGRLGGYDFVGWYKTVEGQEAGKYTIHILKAPEGFAKDDTEYPAPAEPGRMTITLK